MFVRTLLAIVSVLTVVAGGASAGEIAPTVVSGNLSASRPTMSLLPGEGDDAPPHSCYGDTHEKDSDLNAFYPITDEEIRNLLNPGA